METVDLSTVDTRALNQRLQRRSGNAAETSFEVLHPMGRHSLAVGLMHTVDVRIRGHAGYYCAGMNERAQIVVDGNVGVGVAENMMSGTVRVRGDASQSAGATAHGGLLVIEGDASARCGISLKGADIVVGGSVGHMSAFMAQAGRLVVCGDAGANLGDSHLRGGTVRSGHGGEPRRRLRGEGVHGGTSAEPASAARSCGSRCRCGHLPALWFGAPALSLQGGQRGELLNRANAC